MSDQSPQPGWWQASDGTWHPPPKTPGEQSDVSGEPNGAKADEESTTQRRGLSHVDVAGAVLIVVGLVGGIAWVWDLVHLQLTVDGPASLGDRLDRLAGPTPVLLLAAVVAGLGIGLRALAAERSGSTARSVLGSPVGAMLLALTAGFVVLVGGAAIVDDGDDEAADDQAADLESADLETVYGDTVFGDAADIEALDVAPLLIDEWPTVAVPGLGTSDDVVPSHTLEVHSDGCGVFRSGKIGDDLTWVVTDQDGFQVLGRNAAGETQYRFFQPGTYTVVLETWGGSYYVDVSNEVSITC